MLLSLNRSKRISVFFATIVIFILSSTPSIAQEKSLYERLGGIKPISVVVHDFVDRLIANPILKANSMIKAGREHSPVPYLKFQITTFVCAKTGGPCVYTGLGMKESHEHLNITSSEWQAMLDEFQMTPDKFAVPEQEQEELFELFESTKKDIIMPGQ